MCFYFLTVKIPPKVLWSKSDVLLSVCHSTCCRSRRARPVEYLYWYLTFHCLNLRNSSGRQVAELKQRLKSAPHNHGLSEPRDPHLHTAARARPITYGTWLLTRKPVKFVGMCSESFFFGWCCIWTMLTLHLNILSGRKLLRKWSWKSSPRFQNSKHDP